jgi:hypothetical protein
LRPVHAIQDGLNAAAVICSTFKATSMKNFKRFGFCTATALDLSACGGGGETPSSANVLLGTAAKGQLLSVATAAWPTPASKL